MPALMPTPKQQYFGIASIPLIGGKIFTYAAGGSVPKATFTDAAGTIAQPNPIVLNARGEPPNAIFWNGSYRVVIQDALGNLIYTVDNYQTPLMSSDLSIAGGAGAIGFDNTANYGAGTIGKWLTDLAKSAGSSFFGFIQAGAGPVATTVESKLREKVSAMDYMTAAERADVQSRAMTKDVTLAVQTAINATASGGNLTFPPGAYKVTTLTSGRMEANWIFDRAELVAGSTTPQKCVLLFSGLHCNIYGMKLNGNFNLQYNCLLQWYNATDSSQYNNFFGLELRYSKRGIIYGEQPGTASTGYAQSENTIFGLKNRGVERPLFMNHSNGVLFLEAPMLASHNEEWAAFSPGNFDNTTAFAFEANAGVLSIDGGEVQNSTAANTSYCALIGGGEVYINNVITETNVPFLLSGELHINGGRLLNTQSVTDQFVIAPSANSKSKLKVSNCKLYRNNGVGSFSSRRLVANTGSAATIDISFSNCDIFEWAKFVPFVAANGQSAHFDNVRWYPDGTQDAYESVYLLDTRGANLLDRPSIDVSGRTSDGFYQGTYYGGGTVWGISADVPNTSFIGSLSCTTPGQAGWFTADGTSLATVKATSTRVKPGDKFLVECWIKVVGGTAQASVSLMAFDAAGAQLAAPFIAVFDENNFVTTAWQYLRNVITIPAGVAYIGFGAGALQSEVRFCGLQARRADWYTR